MYAAELAAIYCHSKKELKMTNRSGAGRLPPFTRTFDRAVKGLTGNCLAISVFLLTLIIFNLQWQSIAMAQSTGAFTGFKSGGKTPIQIEADRLEVKDKKAMAIFSGNVKVVQGKSLLKADQLKVFYEKGDKKEKKSVQSNSIKRLEVDGTVYVKSEDNEATSDSGSFNMRTEDVELNGNVVLSQGKNVMTGCRFRANLKTGIAKMDSKCEGRIAGKPGRVKMLFEPGKAKTN